MEGSPGSSSESPGSFRIRIVYKHFRVHPFERDIAAITGAYPRLHHYQRGEEDWTPTEHGGRTECFIYDESGSLLSSGVADCSIKDAFCYRIGRDISRGRAMKALNRQIPIPVPA